MRATRVTTTAALAALLLAAGTQAAGARPVGPFEVGGAIEAEFDAAGGVAALGEPTGPEQDAARGGKWQGFARDAAVYWSAATGAQTVAGPVRDKWGQLGAEGGALGYPVTREAATPGDTGRFAHFQGGSVYWSVGTAAHQVSGLIRDKWGSYGWEGSALGFPVTDEQPGARGGRYNQFNGGAIYWSSGTGAHVVWGALREKWVAAGGDGGRYGYPTSDEYDYGDGKAQDFQGGRITWEP